MGDRGLCLQIRARRENSRLRRGRRRCTYAGPGERRRRRMMDGPERSKRTVRKGLKKKKVEGRSAGSFILYNAQVAAGPCTPVAQSRGRQTLVGRPGIAPPVFKSLRLLTPLPLISSYNGHPLLALASVL
jgi:hypothetical protein